MDYGQQEAAKKFGKDPRVYSIATKRFEGDAEGNLQAIHTVQVIWVKGPNGQYQMKEVAGSEKTWPTQLVLLAMGFLGPEEPLLRALKVEQDTRTNIKAEYGRYSTSIPRIFAAGDARRGQSLVVWAINEGRGAARECDRYLMGTTELP